MEPAVGEHPDGSHGPHVFVTDIEAPVLAPEDEHHLRKALRRRDGDPLTVSDGQGRWRPCRLQAVVECVGPIVEVPTPDVTLTIGFALTKGAKPELVVQKMTELGIDVIVPFTAERSIPKWDAAREAKQMARLTRVAREAAMQCRRVRLPEIEAVARFADLVRRPGAVLADRDGPVLAGHATVLVGPEGGWAPGERSGAATVSLGVHTLRAETAAIAAATLMGAARLHQPR